MLNPDLSLIGIAEALYEPLAESAVCPFKDFHLRLSSNTTGRFIP
jgi:hypothetical protein